jgi:hypothetical protein
MKKLLVSFAFACAAVTALAGASHADTSNMSNSGYCRTYPEDVLCMTPEMKVMRAKIMAMTKEKAMEARSNYCRSQAVAGDPACDPKMMNDTTGY